MNLTHIDPTDVIEKVTARYARMCRQPHGTYNNMLSRQVQALAEVLVGEINDVILEIENASDQE